MANSYAASGSVNTEFVQNVYDELWEKTADVWIDYKDNMTRLRLLLADVEVRLNAENLAQHREQLALMRNKMLDKKSTDDLINLSVTFPIVMATNYFVGVNGGGTMKIRLTFIDWLDNTIDISTTKPLKNFFTAGRRFNLQLLDFGYRDYSPKEYDRSLGLATAIKTGFFDAVNFDLGGEQQGMIANLKLFFDRYVEHNESSTEAGRDKLADAINDQENHWTKIENLCSQPIATSRSIFLKSIDQHLYLDTSVESGSSPKDDLDYVKKATDLYTPIRNIEKEIRRIKRTYQMITKTLEELNISSEAFKQQSQVALANHFDVYDKLIKKQKEMIEVVSLN
ncbi:MAG: hypothetical protein MJK18_13315, partial [Bdellovibrionales bacterium]|nr:hypothetical protein [Bdellovibrionales bacterium]